MPKDLGQIDNSHSFIDRYSAIMLSTISLQVAVINEKGVVLACNQAWEDFLKESVPASFASYGIGVNVLDICYKAASEGRRQARHIYENIHAILNGTQEEFYLEYPLSIDKSRWFALKVKAVDGKESGAVITHEEITARVKREKEIMESEASIKTLFDASPIMIWEEDWTEVKTYFDKLKEKGITNFFKYFEEHPDEVLQLADQIKVTQVNKKTLEFCQVSSKEELSPNISDWFGADSLPLFRKELVAIAQGKDHFEGEIPLVTPKKENRDFLIVTSVPTPYLGTLEKVMVSLIDVTEMKEARRKLAQRMKGAMSSILNGQEMERERISKELHDSINPLLTITRLSVDNLATELENTYNLPKKKFNGITALLENAMQGIREILNDLSSTMLRDFGLTKALEQLCNRINQTGKFIVEFQSHGLEERLDPKLELGLYRIGQELLNNVLKHANASAASLQLIRHQDHITMVVDDNGIGFDVSTTMQELKGHGLRNIRSRVNTLEGTLRIDSARGIGTTVIIEISI